VFCILAMTQLGGSVFFTVVLSSLIFGFGHLLLGVEAVPALALSAVPACLLFLWRGSILPLVLYHWIGNIGVLYWQRRNIPEAGKHS
jgi:membrane protease YdiL (CAAX protease family)